MKNVLFCFVLLLAAVFCFAQEPVVIEVANATAVSSSTDSTSLRYFPIDLEQYGVDITRYMTAYWKMSSSIGATNGSIYYFKSPVNGISYLSGVDTIKTYSERATETADTATVRTAIHPFGKYVYIVVDPNIGVGVTGRRDQILTMYLVGTKKKTDSEPRRHWPF
jgi:hypothetical protein